MARVVNFWAVTVAAMLSMAMLAGAQQAEPQPATPSEDPTLDEGPVEMPGPLGAPAAPLGEVRSAGQGPLNLVLIHGLNADARTWDAFMADLVNVEQFTMHSVNLPGYGDAAPPEGLEEYGAWIDNAAAGVLQLIRERGIERPLVVGHATLGGFVALRVAMAAPEEVGGVVQVDGMAPALPIQGRMPPADVRAQLVEAIRPQFETMSDDMWSQMQNVDRLCLNEQFRPLITDMAADARRDVSVRYLLDTMALDWRRQLEQMETPSLWLYAWPTRMTEQERQGRLAAMRGAAGAEGAQRVTVGRSLRFMMFDRPDTLRTTLLMFSSGERIDNAIP